MFCFVLRRSFQKEFKIQEVVFLSFVTVFQCFPNNSSLTLFIEQEGPHKIFMRPFNKLRNAIDIVMLIKLILNCV